MFNSAFLFSLPLLVIFLVVVMRQNVQSIYNFVLKIKFSALIVNLLKWSPHITI